MKTYFIDSNIFIRYFLKDNPAQFQIATRYFNQAKNQEINLVIIPEIILEIDYVLRKVYQLPKSKILYALKSLVAIPYLDCRKKEFIINALALYKSVGVDLVDIFLYQQAQAENAQVFSFDKDFQKLAKVKP